jgi:hypothetical protein
LLVRQFQLVTQWADLALHIVRALT